MESNIKKNSDKVCKSLQELATTVLASAVVDQIKNSEEVEKKEVRTAIKEIESSLTENKDILCLVVVLDNTASQSSSWELIRATFQGLIPFLESRHGEEDKFKIEYEIRMIYANDYDTGHLQDAAASKRNMKTYIATPREARSDSEQPVVGELCRITSESSEKEKDLFLQTLSEMKCYGGGDRAEAYTPALDLATEHVMELTKKYGKKAVIATIFCGDDIPHGCSSQCGSYRDNWDDGDPSGLDWFQVIANFPVPIHCLSPPHADNDSRCTLGYAAKKSGGFHLTVNADSSRILLRLLMAEMKLSWLVERNLRDMEGASAGEISAKIAEIVNKESFERPTNTVPIDPRIEKIDEEIANNGIKPRMMRMVSEQLPHVPNLPLCKRALSSTVDGVSSSSILRALRTATGGDMPPGMMRMVSDSVILHNPETLDVVLENPIPDIIPELPSISEVLLPIPLPLRRS